MNRRLPRLAAAILVGGGLLGGLSACYVGPPVVPCTRQVTSGNSSAAVSVRGALPSAPTVSFPTPLRPSTTQATILIPGRGEPIPSDAYASAFLTIYDGTTGALLDQSDYAGGNPSSFRIADLPIKGLRQGLQCAKPGSRVAVVVPAGEAFSAANRPPGMGANDSLVVVADIKGSYLGRAQGIAQVAQSGMPSVVLAPDGRPGITVPKTGAPAKLRVATLIAGSGAKLKQGDQVLVNYTGVLWKTGAVFDSSWENGRPVPIALSSGQAIPGFLGALKGARVGDQVLAVIPPDQAYGAQGTSGVPANSTLVFVVDVLGIVRGG